MAEAFDAGEQGFIKYRSILMLMKNYNAMPERSSTSAG
jgi:hypothetical protein